MLDLLKNNLMVAYHRMKQLANNKRSEKEFSVGDQVYLKQQPYKHKSMAYKVLHKLSAKYYGQYKIIERIGAVTYKLSLPSSISICLVFHVSQLEQHHGNKRVFEDLPVMTKESILQPQAEIDKRIYKFYLKL